MDVPAKRTGDNTLVSSARKSRKKHFHGIHTGASATRQAAISDWFAGGPHYDRQMVKHEKPAEQLTPCSPKGANGVIGDVIAISRASDQGGPSDEIPLSEVTTHYSKSFANFDVAPADLSMNNVLPTPRHPGELGQCDALNQVQAVNNARPLTRATFREAQFTFDDILRISDEELGNDLTGNDILDEIASNVSEVEEEDAREHLDAAPSEQLATSTCTDLFFTCLREKTLAHLRDRRSEVEEFLGQRLVEQAERLEEFQAELYEFVDLESNLFGHDSKLIVRPSGAPESSLHLKLNYPTFRTKMLHDGESADPTNNCTNLLLLKGLSTDNAFWFEAFFRRSSSAPEKAWSDGIRHLHADFSRSCEKRSKAVLLLFGAPNRKDFMERYKGLVYEQHVPVTNTERVTIGLVRDKSENLCFIVVFCPHPEWLFWHWTVWAGRYVDACINVACALAGVVVCPDYFETRAKCVVAISSDKFAFRDTDTTRKLERQNHVLCHPSDLPQNIKLYCAREGITEARLVKEFEGNRSVAELLYQLIRERQPKTSSWNQGVRMPRNLPRNLPAQKPAQSLSADIDGSPSPSSIRLIPNKTRSSNPIIQAAMIHAGRRISLMCIRCGATPKAKPIDNAPAFCTTSSQKGKYIAQRQACATPACNPVGRKGQVDQFMIPQDTRIPFIRSDNLTKVRE